MADVIKLVNATKLDADLTNVSNAIKDLNSSFGSMSFPDGMIQNLQTVGDTLSSQYGEIYNLTSERDWLRTAVQSGPQYTLVEGTSNYQLTANSIPEHCYSDFNFILIVGNLDPLNPGLYIWKCTLKDSVLSYETIIGTGFLSTANDGDVSLSFMHDYYPVFYNNTIYVTSHVNSGGNVYLNPVGWYNNQYMLLVTI